MYMRVGNSQNFYNVPTQDCRKLRGLKDTTVTLESKVLPSLRLCFLSIKCKGSGGKNIFSQAFDSVHIILPRT